MSNVREVYVCPYCKKIFMQDEFGEKKRNTCSCGYKGFQFKNYTENVLTHRAGVKLERGAFLASDEEVQRENKKNLQKEMEEYLSPKLSSEKMLTLTDCYIEKYAVPYVDKKTLEEKKHKDYSFWFNMGNAMLPALLLIFLFSFAGGPISVLFAALWIGFIAYKNIQGGNLEKEKTRVMQVKKIEEDNQKEFHLARIYTGYDRSLPMQPIEEKYIQIKQWSFSMIGYENSKNIKELYLEILYSIMKRICKSPDNVIIHVDSKDVKKYGRNYYREDSVDSIIDMKIKVIYGDRFTKEDIYNRIMNGDTVFFFDMDLERKAGRA